MDQYNQHILSWVHTQVALVKSEGEKPPEKLQVLGDEVRGLILII